MRTIRTILGVSVGLFLITGIASAIVAAITKQRLVSSGSEPDDEFDVVAIYEGHAFASTAPALRQAKVLTWYGGGTIDLREATLHQDGARLTVRALFGGIQLVVPETWRVEADVRAVFGGVADGRDPDRIAPDGPVLRLDGFAIFGGVWIVSEAREVKRRTIVPAQA